MVRNILDSRATLTSASKCCQISALTFTFNFFFSLMTDYWLVRSTSCWFSAFKFSFLRPFLLLVGFLSPECRRFQLFCNSLFVYVIFALSCSLMGFVGHTFLSLLLFFWHYIKSSTASYAQEYLCFAFFNVVVADKLGLHEVVSQFLFRFSKLG